MFAPAANLLRLACLVATLLPLACLAGIGHQEAIDLYRQQRLGATRERLAETEDLAMSYLFRGIDDIDTLSGYIQQLNDKNSEDPVSKGALSEDQFREKLIARYIDEPCHYYMDTFKTSLKPTLLEPQPELMKKIEEDVDFTNALVTYQICELIFEVVEKSRG